MFTFPPGGPSGASTTDGGGAAWTGRLRTGSPPGVVPRAAWALVFLLLPSACGMPLAEQGSTEQVIGRASYHNIMAEIPEILMREGYAIYKNRETSRTLYLETSWQERAPFEDEAAMGVEYARTRFVLRGRRTAPRLYTLRLEAQNQVRGAFQEGEWHDRAGAWSTAPLTDMYRAYVDEISTEIQLKVDAGLRTYSR